jgi:hypothetical protein
MTLILETNRKMPDHKVDHTDLPLGSYDLIKLLDKIYPHRCILPNETLESAHRYAGTRALIDELVEQMNDELDPNRQA